MTEIETALKESHQFVDDFIKKRKSNSGDVLVHILNTLVGYYDYIGNWCASENKIIQDARLEIQAEYAIRFLEARKSKNTLEHAKYTAKLATIEKKKELNKTKAYFDEVTAWKKSISKYIDITRSQLSFEKSLANIE